MIHIYVIPIVLPFSPAPDSQSAVKQLNCQCVVEILINTCECYLYFSTYDRTNGIATQLCSDLCNQT